MSRFEGRIRDGGSSHMFECVFLGLALPPCRYASHHGMKKSASTRIGWLLVLLFSLQV